MKIKVGDNVQLLAGKDRGKSGKVLQVFVRQNKVVVEGLNLAIKHQKARRQGEKGQRIQFPAPIDASNAGLVCAKCAKPTRVGYKLERTEAGTTKTRVCKKCQSEI
ncbi:MAG: 50S ribosomal protein L24 [Candidatus Buchananbacteria bacterium]|nr:50S ribosomal protein L24 [Candidatus Buchananbacteria bacterium]